jgi:hypothetical protein
MLSLVLVESLFTVLDVAKILRAVEGCAALSARMIRYYARTGMVTPSAGRLRATKRARATRLYTASDIALLRLVCRLRRRGVHERALWGVLVYRGDELRARLASGDGEIVIDDRAVLRVGDESATQPAPIRVPVAPVVRGLAERLTAYRRRQPKLWTGLAWVPAADAQTTGSR